ncbi:MAG: tetratricopeptide repeat protein, partial [bacterium]
MRLQAGGQDRQVRDHHLEHFLKMAEEAEPHLTGADQKEWLDRLETEHVNLRAAIDWALEAPPVIASSSGAPHAGTTRHSPPAPGANESPSPDSPTPEHALSGLRLAASLWRFWDIHGHHSEGRVYLNLTMLQGESRSLVPPSSTSAVGQASDFVKDGSSGLAAALTKANYSAGALAIRQGDFVAAYGSLEKALVLARRIADNRLTASALNGLGLIAAEKGDFREARSRYMDSLEMQRIIGNKLGMASALGNLGNIAFSDGDYTEARKRQEESLSLFREIGDKHGLANTLGNLGVIARQLGDLDAARRYHEESLTLRREIGDRHGIATSMSNLGNVAGDLGDLAEMRKCYEGSIAIQYDIGDKRGLAISLEGFAGLAGEERQYARGVRLYGAAITLRNHIGAPLPPSDQGEHDAYISKARAALGDAAFDKAFAEG